MLTLTYKRTRISPLHAWLPHMKRYTRSLFIFRRDLRLYDNTALIEAAAQSHEIIPCFIFDPRQVGNQNEFKSTNSIQFMLDCLDDLYDQIKDKNGRLLLFKGYAHEVVAHIIKHDVDAIFVNADYTPFSRERDNALATVCATHDVAFHSYHDVMLNEPTAILTKAGTPYGVFTPFYRASSAYVVPEPVALRSVHFVHPALPHTVSLRDMKHALIKERNELCEQGGRTAALKICKHLSTFKHYAQERDFPALATTRFSAHLKFGTLSAREAYYAIAHELGNNHPLLRQLYWRDFWTCVAYHRPAVYGSCYQEKYNKLWWSKSEKHFDAWCTGQTGFPIVDAGMRELNATGFMHNRVRMIVASFLTKDLHIDWRSGEQYFAQHLTDYDPALNNGNWQWAASTGCDPQPYFRIFNPWLQQKKFDPECAYIKQWIPELEKYSHAIIHAWDKQSAGMYKHYPKPIVSHALESKEAIKLFKAC